MIDPRILDHAPWGQETEFIVLAQAGSNAHGTVIDPGVLGKDNTHQTDDVDYLGAYWPPLHKMLGLDRQDSWVERFDELDVTTYSVDKLIRLLLKANPNIMGLLWTPAHLIVHRTETFNLLVDYRELFLAKKPIYNAFKGYAHDQLRKMTAGQLYQGYMGEKRRALVETYGYDIKNAAHLIRLLHMCIEVLNDGVFYVDRTAHDADQLMAIKRGEVELREIQESAKRLFEFADIAYQNSPLPELMDREKIDILMTSLQWSHIQHTSLPATR